MPDLSPVITDALEKFQLEVTQLRRGGSQQEPKPHKLILLLAVLDMADEGLIPENKIFFASPLLELFEKHFRQIAKPGDWCQPSPPFFHLRSADFWHHKIYKGREEAYAKLKTSGGGTKRITDNIEYAYLSPYAYSVISDPDARSQLRSFISLEVKDYLQNSGENSYMHKRIGTMFHESFSLSRPAIGAVMSVIETEELSGGLHATLRQQTHLGKNYVKAMPQYARGCGLLTLDNQPTAFGTRALNSDPLLETQTTQWLMHYFLSTPHGPGPAFWHEFVKTRFRFGDELTKSSLAEQLVDFVNSSESKKLKLNSATSTANIFVGTYTKDDGLGRLGLMEEVGDSYRILESDPPPVWAFAVALLDFWQFQFPNRVTINLDELYADGGLTNIFMIGEGRINRYLRTLQQEGIVDVFRVAPPYQVVLLKPDPTLALDRLYTHDDNDQ